MGHIFAPRNNVSGLRTVFCSLLCVAAILSGCAGGSIVHIPDAVVVASPSQPTSSVAPLDKHALNESEEEMQQDGDVEGAKGRPLGLQERSELRIDPPYDFDPLAMKPSEFGGFFSQQYPSTAEETTLLAGTVHETKMITIQSQNEGPTVFVVGGTHGNEQAGWYAASLLSKVTLKSGRLCVISAANVSGIRLNRRQVQQTNGMTADLNRSYPGSADASETEQIAYCVFSQIKAEKPAIVLDFHEAANTDTAKADYLGSSLVYSELAGMDELFFDLLFATETGEVCSEAYSSFSPAPAGSLNREVTRLLEIPVITTETFRGYPMERRITDHLDIARYVLEYYQMI